MTPDTVLTLDWRLQDRLSRALDHADLSVSDMASILGVSRQTVSSYLHGHTVPSLGFLRVWASTTGVDLGWLVRDTGSDTHREHDQADDQLTLEFALAA